MASAESMYRLKPYSIDHDIPVPDVMYSVKSYELEVDLILSYLIFIRPFPVTHTSVIHFNSVVSISKPHQLTTVMKLHRHQLKVSRRSALSCHFNG